MVFFLSLVGFGVFLRVGELVLSLEYLCCGVGFGFCCGLIFRVVWGKCFFMVIGGLDGSIFWVFICIFL